MFTGIITDVGQVIDIKRGEGDTRMTVACHYGVDTIDIGASIAHSGACMTVIDKGEKHQFSPYYPTWYSFDVSDESLSKTTMKKWKPGDQINLERAMTAADELGGHFVTGHVDGKGKIRAIKTVAGSIEIEIKAPDGLMFGIAPKGSIAVDGVSLTVNTVTPSSFYVNIIPHTASVTTLGKLGVGDKVNLEIDVIARYVARYMKYMKAAHD